ncbi:30S ribosomal protein S3, partial [Mycobacterium avium]|nr:30S ribosomal protein S3 [Mycobacterium avium]
TTATGTEAGRAAASADESTAAGQFAEAAPAAEPQSTES